VAAPEERAGRSCSDAATCSSPAAARSGRGSTRCPRSPRRARASASPFATAREPDSCYTLTMAFAHNGDVELYYETFGSRDDPALLLVNGLGSQCITYREEWCGKFAAEGFRVIRFDNRDVGLSSKLDAAAVP